MTYVSQYSLAAAKVLCHSTDVEEDPDLGHHQYRQDWPLCTSYSKRGWSSGRAEQPEIKSPYFLG